MTTHIRQLELGAATPVRLSAGGAPLAALRAGDAGSSVLLVPGFTGSKEDFAPLLDLIADARHHVWAIDLPGQYESPGPEDPAGYSVEALGRTVLALAATLPGPVHLVGHSFGGLVARSAVVADPARFGSLVLMDSGPSGVGGGRRARMELLRPVLAAHGVAGVYAAMQAQDRARPDYVAPPAPLEEFLRRRFLAGSAAMLEGMGDALAAEPDRVEELRRTGMALLVLHGDREDAWPPDIQHDLATRLGTVPVVIPDAAHSPAVENPEATAAALLGFWAGVERDG